MAILSNQTSNYRTLMYKITTYMSGAYYEMKCHLKTNVM